MKKLTIFLFFAIYIALNASGQTPQAIPYQAVARDVNSNVIANQNISLRFTIHDSIPGGTIVYQETQSVTTNALGLFVVNIGQGTVKSGTFAGINWSHNNKFTQVEMDATGGSTYVSMGTSQMLSVPYALYAGSSTSSSTGWSTSGNSGTNASTNFIGTTDNVGLAFRVGNGKAGLIDLVTLNTSLGASSLYNTTGNYNTAIGGLSLFTNNNGTSNTAIGYRALYSSTGSSNTALGANALQTNSLGTTNTAIGFQADVGSGSLSNATAIGANAVVNISNAVILGNGANVGIGTSSPAVKLDIENGTTSPSFKLVDGTQASGKVLTSDASGDGTWQVAPSGSSIAGTTNYMIKFTAASTGGNSLLYDNGSNIGLGTTTPAVRFDIENGVTSPAFRLVDGTQASGKVLTSDASGNATWQVAPSGSSIAGTSNYMIKFTGASTGGNSLLYDNGTNLGIGTTSPTVKFDIENGTTSPAFKLVDGTQAAGKVLTSDASGNATWQTVSGGGGGGSLSGTTNYIIKFTGPSAGGNSLLYDNGTSVGIGTTSPTYLLQVTGSNATSLSLFNNTNATGNGLSVQNAAAAGSSAGNGLIGQTQQSGGAGVLGGNLNTSGTGVVGVGNNTPYTLPVGGAGGAFYSTGIGVYGFSSTYTAYGVYGKSTNASNSYGVVGVANGVGGAAPAPGSGGAFSGYDYGVSGVITDQNYGGGTQMAAGYFGLGFNGTSYASLTLVEAVSGTTGAHYKIWGSPAGTVATTVPDLNGKQVTLHAPETPEFYFQDYGQGQLVNGVAHIDIDPIYAKNVIVSQKHPLRVFIQLEENENCKGVVVKNKTATGFDVVELGGGNSNTPFQWTITCNVADAKIGNKISPFADLRFEPGPVSDIKILSDGDSKESKKLDGVIVK